MVTIGSAPPLTSVTVTPRRTSAPLPLAHSSNVACMAGCEKVSSGACCADANVGVDVTLENEDAQAALSRRTGERRSRKSAARS
jgi:hypothetical protein